MYHNFAFMDWFGKVILGMCCYTLSSYTLSLTLQEVGGGA